MSLPSALPLLRELIRIPSVNPDGDPGCDKTGEAAVAEFLFEKLRSLGAECRLDEVLPGRPNLVARFPSRGEKPRLILAPHTDTVSVAGMRVDPFGAEVRDGKVFGRGSTDTKGTMAAMITALESIGSRALENLGHEIWFAGLMGEEAGNQGARALAEQVAGEGVPAFALVGEPTSLRTVHLHKGCSVLRLETWGKAVHSSEPGLGRNAVLSMLDVLAWLREILPGELAGFSEPGLTPPTFNIGILRGGVKSNIVPDHCVAAVDFRTVPEQEKAGFVPGLEARLKERFPELGVTRHTNLSLAAPADHACLRNLRAMGSEFVGVSWFCDAAIFAAAGIPAVAAGPGSIEQAHTADEWLSIEDLENGVRFYRTFLLQC